MTTTGYIVIADITGYTAYLKGSELEHAEDSLRSLLEVLIEQTKSPLVISRLEGDAVISYTPQAGFLQGQSLVELIENSYVAFRRARERMRLNTTCTCNACRNIPNLDLKFFVNHGSFMLQEMPMYTELIGNDVNVTHRLVKNHIKEQTGVRAYAAYTAAAVEALGIQEFAAQLTQHREEFADVGEVELFVQDLMPVWEREREQHQIVVDPAEAGLIVDSVIPAPPSLAWDYFTKPEYRMLLMEAESMPVENRNLGRTGSGTVYYCAHGSGSIRQPVLDWRPFDYYTYESELPMGMTAMVTVRFEPIDGGQSTLVRQICGKPVGSLVLRTLANSAPFKNKIIKGIELGVETLKAKIQEELDTGAAVRAEPVAVPEEQLRAAVQASLAAPEAG